MQSELICRFLLVSSGFLSIGVVSDIRIVEKGRPVLLFENFDRKTVKEVNVRVNGVEDPTLVVTFTFVNKSIITDWNAAEEDNYGNIYMDAKRNILIAEMDKNYEKKFYIDSSEGDSSKILLEVELTISKTNYSTTVRTVLNKTTQKGDALPETSYSTTERTPQKETTQKGDALPDCNSSETYFRTTSYVFMGLVIVMLLIIMGKKKIALMCKKRNRNKKGQESTDKAGQYLDLQQSNKTGKKNQEDKSTIDEDTSQALLTTTT